MRLLVCGGRNFCDVPRLWRKLDEINVKWPVSVLIDGASDDVTGPYIGADYWAHMWAVAHDKETVRVHADWKTQGRAAGPLRNQRMLTEQYPQMLLATDGGRGTANMIGLAGAAQIYIERC